MIADYASPLAISYLLSQTCRLAWQQQQQQQTKCLPPLLIILIPMLIFTILQEQHPHPSPITLTPSPLLLLSPVSRPLPPQTLICVVTRKQSASSLGDMFPVVSAVSKLPRSVAMHRLSSRCINVAARPTRRAKPLIPISISMFSSSSMPDQDDEFVHQQYHHIEEQAQDLPKRNIRLEAIKSVGMTQLHNQTQDLISRTKQPLFDEEMLDQHGQKRQSIAQIQEANRLESALLDAFAAYSTKHTTFSIKGQCVDVLGVEVSADLKQARAYWCLPKGIDLHHIPQKKLEQLVRGMQQRLEERGGKIQALVHTRLRSYYPPKIKWVPAEHVSKDLKRGVSLEGGKKKWG